MFGATKLVACSLLCLLSILVCGCGGSASPSTTDGSATSRPSTAASPEAQDSAQEPVQFAANDLAPDACKALSLAAAESFDGRLDFQGAGGSLDACSYNTPSEQTPSLQLILELVPSPAEPLESAAKKICHELIEEIKHDPDYEGSEAVPALGEESNVASGFEPAEMDFDEDETIYIADWREDGSCARLIYAGTGSVTLEPLPEFIALAESISTSGN